MRILILGGTGFLGPHTVEYAKARGHTLTLFNRGKTNPEMFPNVERLEGDRNEGTIDALATGEWDVAIDNSGYVPGHVRAAAEILKDRVKQYIFVSSISVYPEFSKVGINESDPVATVEPEILEQVTTIRESIPHYSGMKALCEQAAEDVMPGRVANIRPGLIVGPLDGSDRFTYWPVRIERGGEVLAPGNPSDAVQYIDVRDLARWIIHVAENNVTGVYNATGPTTPTNIGELLYGCKAVTGSDATFTWVDAEFLGEHGVAPWQHMTVWVPPTPETAGFGRIDCSKAFAAGLTSRPLADTVRDTLKWWHEQDAERRANLRAGLPAEREAEVLKAWHERSDEG